MELEESEPLPAPTAACITDTATLQSGQQFHSSDLNPPIDKGRNLAHMPSNDLAKSPAKEPKKDSQEAQNLKTHHHPQVSLEEASADVPHEGHHSLEPEVEQYYYQVNWPQAIRQKWAREKERRERRLNHLGIGQDAVVVASHTPEQAPEEQNLAHGEPEDMNGGSWDNTKIVLQHTCLEDR